MSESLLAVFNKINNLEFNNKDRSEKLKAEFSKIINRLLYNLVESGRISEEQSKNYFDAQIKMIDAHKSNVFTGHFIICANLAVNLRALIRSTYKSTNT